MTSKRHYFSRYEILASRYAILLHFCEQLIQKHGIARNIASEADKSNSFNDYMLLCFTKATKTFGSNYILITGFRGEDALILARSIYEAYLNISFLLANPEEINSLVAGKVGLSSGSYVRRKKKIIDPETSKEIGQLVSIGYMAKNTRFPEDAAVHEFIYPYLCSYSHMDIFTIDQYLDGSHFTTQSPHRIHQAGLYSFFFFSLILDEFSLFKGFSKTERARCARMINTSKRYVTEILEYMKVNSGNGDAPERFLARWNRVGTGWIT